MRYYLGQRNRGEQPHNKAKHMENTLPTSLILTALATANAVAYHSATDQRLFAERCLEKAGLHRHLADDLEDAFDRCVPGPRVQLVQTAENHVSVNNFWTVEAAQEFVSGGRWPSDYTFTVTVDGVAVA